MLRSDLLGVPTELGDDTWAHFPRDDVAGEAALARANERAHAASVEWLLQRLPGLDLTAVTDPAHSSFQIVSAEPDYVAELDGRRFFDRLVATSGAPPPKLHFAIEGDTERQPEGVLVVRQKTYGLLLQPGRLAGAMVEGFSAIYDVVEDNDLNIRRLAEHVGRVFAADLNVNLYASHGTTTGFGPHWDDHDVLIVPLHGRKHWDLRAPAAPSPVRGVVGPAVSDDSVWADTIGPGDALYIPRGWGHVVTPVDELTIHLTVSIRRLLVADVLGYLTAIAPTAPAVRRDAPFERPEQAVRGPLSDWLTDTYDSLTEPAVLERAVAVWCGRLGDRGAGALTEILDFVDDPLGRDVTVRSAMPGGLVIAAEDDEWMEVGGGRRLWPVHRSAVEALGTLSDGAAHPVDEPAGGLDPQVLRLFVHDALLTGLLDLVPEAEARGLTPAGRSGR